MLRICRPLLGSMPAAGEVCLFLLDEERMRERGGRGEAAGTGGAFEGRRDIFERRVRA